MKNLLDRALYKIEAFVRTDIRYLLRSGGWLLLGQSVTYGSIIILSLAFANFVSQEIYGTYKYLLSLTGILSIFTLTGMGTAISRAVARGDRSSIHSATKQRIIWSLLGSFFAFIISAYYYFHDNETLSFSLLIISVTLPFFDTFTLYNAHLTGTRNFKVQATGHLISQTISIGSVAGTLVLTDNVIYIIAAYFIPLAIVRVALYHALIERPVNNPPPDKDVLRYGKHMSLINVLGVISANTDTLLLWQLLGPQKVAVYLFALAIPEQIKGPLKSISELAFPKFAAQTEEQIGKNLPQIIRKMWIYGSLLLFISIVYVLLAPLIFSLLFPQYLESVLYSQVFMLASVALVGTIPISILSAQRKIKEQYIFSTVQPILQIIAYIIFIPLYGVWGAIIARLVMRTFYVSFTVHLLKKALS